MRFCVNSTYHQIRTAFCRIFCKQILIRKEVIMKALKFLSIAIISSLAIISCSNPVYVQKDDTANFSGYKTYMWVDTRSSENDNSARTTAFMDIGMRNEVSK